MIIELAKIQLHSNRYEDGSDLAYFDGLSDTILSVALLRPKKDIFQAHIKYLLCLIFRDWPNGSLWEAELLAALWCQI